MSLPPSSSGYVEMDRRQWGSDWQAGGCAAAVIIVLREDYWCSNDRYASCFHEFSLVLGVGHSDGWLSNSADAKSVSSLCS